MIAIASIMTTAASLAPAAILWAVIGAVGALWRDEAKCNFGTALPHSTPGDWAQVISALHPGWIGHR